METVSTDKSGKFGSKGDKTERARGQQWWLRVDCCVFSEELKVCLKAAGKEAVERQDLNTWDERCWMTSWEEEMMDDIITGGGDGG